MNKDCKNLPSLIGNTGCVQSHKRTEQSDLVKKRGKKILPLYTLDGMPAVQTDKTNQRTKSPIQFQLELEIRSLPIRGRDRANTHPIYDPTTTETDECEFTF